MAQINWNNVLPQDSVKALTSIAACVVVLVGAGWGLFSFGYSRGKDIGQDELAAYKAASDAKLPEVTAGLVKISNELREGLKVYERNKTLEAENASFQAQVAESSKTRAGLEASLKKAEETVNDLQAQVAKFTGKSRRFSMSERSTEILGEGHVLAVLTAISSSATINLDNKQQNFSLGSYLPIEFSDKVCTLTLIGIDSSWNSQFELECKPK